MWVTAARKAVQNAIAKAPPVILDPIGEIEISAPDHAIGDITGALAGMVTRKSNLGQGSVRV